MGIKIVLNIENCSNHSACIDAAPDIFDWNEDDSLKIKVEDPGEELRDQIEDAVRACPTQSLSIVED